MIEINFLRLHSIILLNKQRAKSKINILLFARCLNSLQFLITNWILHFNFSNVTLAMKILFNLIAESFLISTESGLLKFFDFRFNII